MTSYLTIFITILWFLYYYFTRTFNYWKGKNVKGPNPILFFGNFKDVSFRRKHVGMLYKELYDQYPDEKVVGLYRMTAPTLLIRDLDVAKQILNKEFESFPDRGLYYSKEALGDNLFHTNVEVSKILRKHFSLIFTTSKFKRNFQSLINRADKFMDYVEDITMNKLEHDVLQVFRKYAVDSIMFYFFGIDMDAYNDDNNLANIIDKAIQTPRYLVETELLFPGILMKYNLAFFPEKVLKFSQQVIQAGVNSQQQPNVNRNSVMDVLMGLRQEGDIGKANNSEKELRMKVTDDVLTGQVFILYFAGYGNNTLLSTYAMYHLAENPDVQEILINEIDEVLQKHDGKFTYEALSEMKYLQMVFEETLRMHPLTNSITRNAARDIQVESIDFVIEKDTIVVVSPYAIQHDEKYYPDPEKFEPTRFSPENVRERHSCAMLTFGSGPRSCLGRKFAQVQFGVCMVQFLLKFRVEFTENTIKRIGYSPMHMLLTPSENIYLRLVRRNR